MYHSLDSQSPIASLAFSKPEVTENQTPVERQLGRIQNKKAFSEFCGPDNEETGLRIKTRPRACFHSEEIGKSDVLLYT